MKLSKFFADCFDDIYVFDGLDPLNQTLNGHPCDLNDDRIKSFRKNWLTRISTFLGFPNRELIEGEPQTGWILFYNFIGVKPDSTNILKDIAKLIVTIPVNVLTLPYKLLRNVLKIGTELIPHMGLLLSKKLQDKLNENYTNAAMQNNILSAILWKTLSNFNFLFIISTFDTLLFIGRAITSPILNILLAWKDNDKDQKEENLSPQSGRLEKLWYHIKQFNKKYKILKVISVLCSIAATMIVYSILLPYLTAFIAPTIMPFLSAHCPAPILNATNWLVNQLSGPLASFSQSVLTVVEPFVSFWISPVPGIDVDPYIGIASMPQIIGVGLIAGAMISTLGTGIFKLTEALRNWWWKKPIEIINPAKLEELQKSSAAKLFCCFRLNNPLSKQPIPKKQHSSDLKSNISFVDEKLKKIHGLFNKEKVLPKINKNNNQQFQFKK